VREAADFCRYYAMLARRHFEQPQALPSPTGESNQLALHGRGTFACISPWNFPLAIHVGQIAAALAAGNAVIAKPAEQTPLVAQRAAKILAEAGLPAGVYAMLPGAGETVGAALVGDSRTAGVAFTGSTEVARAIGLALARRPTLVPLIAETGGQNALIVDSSALPEQLVVDAVTSAFNSAGQRCSALRVLFLQQEIAPRVVELLIGAMDELAIGDPAELSTDVGPVIDEDAKKTLEAHVAAMAGAGRVLHRVALPPASEHGTFVAPTLIELDGIGRLQREVFGPVLHVVRYPAGALDQVIDAINASTPQCGTSPRGRASAMSMSTVTSSEPSSACSRSAAKGCPAPARKQAARIIFSASPSSVRCRSTPPRREATPRCSRRMTLSRPSR
jgi:RHH-type proline utilization regulon transcriptional repressor/proline dehydrogenase/delta 1-pyrroline-5-carboxylate dehydrogenase